MSSDTSKHSLRQHAELYRLALTYTERMAVCISAAIDACEHDDAERASHFSKMARRHALQAESYLSA